jgi:hypothetical protein
MTRRDATLGAAAALVALAANVAVIAWALGAPPHRPRDVRELDHRRYIAMAEAPPGRAVAAGAAERPFCYRVLVPAVVRVLAGGDSARLHVAFWGTTMLFLWAFLFALFAWLREQGLSALEALAGVALAGLTPGAVRWYAYQYWMPDPACLLLVTLGLVLARRRKGPLLALVSVAGFLTRETFALVPLWATLRWTREDGLFRGLRRSALSFAPGLLAWVAVRAAIVPAGGSTLAEAAAEMLAFRARHLLDNQLYFASLGSFGVLVPLVLLRGRARLARALRTRYEDAALLAAAYASLAFANNTDRLLVYALPVLLPPALRSAAGLWPRAASGLVAAVLAQAWFHAVTPGWGSAGLSLYQPVRWSVVGVCGLLLVWGALRLRRANAYSS